jgi:phosphatidylinositol glycan class A protein
MPRQAAARGDITTVDYPVPVQWPAPGKHCICIVSDFFLPRLGGVELHQYQLAQCLRLLGHKVIVVTGSYGLGNARQGVRYLAGVKVYYCPQIAFHNQVSVPTLFAFWPLFRNICVRERVDIVHGHQTTSPMAHECLCFASSFGLRTVYTDHSLFGFANAAAVHVNKLMKFTLAGVDHVICVSHTLKENLVLRARLSPGAVSTIPNALDHARFRPAPPPAAPPAAVVSSEGAAPARVNIVVLSRLVYRKGIDLIVDVIPSVCARFPHVNFIIGGDGPKRVRLEEMRERHALQDRVELLGEVAQADVRSVLVRGDVFLNCSLTESFCIAILEAVACGLYVVSTRVGGVPEILPPSFISFAEPAVESVLAATLDAVPRAAARDPTRMHEFVARHYSWHAVAARTAAVYDAVVAAPRRSLGWRLRRYAAIGPFSGPIMAGVIALASVVLAVLELVWPRRDIELVPVPAENDRGPGAWDDWTDPATGRDVLEFDPLLGKITEPRR